MNRLVIAMAVLAAFAALGCQNSAPEPAPANGATTQRPTTEGGAPSQTTLTPNISVEDQNSQVGSRL